MYNYVIDTSHIYTQEGRTASNKIYVSGIGDRYFKEDTWNFALGHDSIAMSSNNPNFTTLFDRLKKENNIVVDFLDSRDLDFIEDIISQISIVFISGSTWSSRKHYLIKGY